jgi:hypothetical protein
MAATMASFLSGGQGFITGLACSLFGARQIKQNNDCAMSEQIVTVVKPTEGSNSYRQQPPKDRLLFAVFP